MNATDLANPAAPADYGASLDYVTLSVGDQLFGLPIGRVHDVFITQRVTPVPGASAEVVGLLNLRGKVVTALSLARRLGLEPARPMGDANDCELTAVGVEIGAEPYALVVDAVGEVLRLPAAGFAPPPINLDPRWTAVAAGIHRLEKHLLVVLDLDAVIRIDVHVAA